MQVTRNSLRIEAICNGYALMGRTANEDTVFLAHLGDGVDGLPDPRDPDLAEVYGFELLPGWSVTTVQPPGVESMTMRL